MTEISESLLYEYPLLEYITPKCLSGKKGRGDSQNKMAFQYIIVIHSCVLAYIKEGVYIEDKLTGKTRAISSR